MDLEILKKLVEFDTRSENTNLPLIYYCQKKFEEYGFETRIWGKDNKANLFAFKPAYGSRIVLSAHTDTVPPGEGWNSDPFKLEQNEDSIIGLGIADMKIFIAIMLKLAQANLAKNLAFLLTYNEETDFEGAKLIDRKIIGKSDYLIIGEPTGGKIITNSKGLVAYELELTGKGGHGSEPENGVSSILDSSKFILELSKGFKEIQEKNKDDSFVNPLPTLNFGTISGGEAINSIPVGTNLSFEIRTTNAAVEKIFNELIKKTSKSLKSSVSFTKKISLNPFVSSGKVVKIIKKSGLPVEKGPSYATEANILADICPNAVIFGPGEIKYAHKENEKISFKGIVKYKKDLTYLISVLK
ncbi:MAG: M20/M25/M40 family metallo-hydrolase [Patescibacteria group bacterium]|jgi:acetylornithine deacetylase